MNLFMIVMYSYLAAMGIAVWFYYRTLIPGLTSWLWPLAVVGCTVSYLVSHSGYIVHPEPLARALAWIGNVWILFGFYSLLLMLLNGILYFFAVGICNSLFAILLFFPSLYLVSLWGFALSSTLLHIVLTNRKDIQDVVKILFKAPTLQLPLS